MRCVSKDWLNTADTLMAWTGTCVEISRVVLPTVERSKRLWTMIERLIVSYINVPEALLMHKPLLYRSDWLLRNDSPWLTFQVLEDFDPCCVQWTRWPALPLVILQCSLKPNWTYGPVSHKFSMGWTTAQSACQLARVVFGELRQGDENVHVCIFNIPDLNLHVRDRDHVEFAHRRGEVDAGFIRYRSLPMVSPIYELQEFRLSLAMDVARNRFCTQVNDDPIISTPGFFSESQAPESMQFGLPTWFFCVYTYESQPPHVDLRHVDVSIDDALMTVTVDRR